MVLIAIKRLYSGSAPLLRERAATISLVVLLMTVVVGTKPLQIKVSSAATTDGDPLRQVIYGAVFALLLWASQVHRLPTRLLPMPLFISLFLGWSALSLGWSIAPDIAIRRLLLTTMLVWTIFRAVGELGYWRSLLVVRAVLGLLLVLNYLAVAGSPVAIHRVGEFMDENLIGSWRGLLPHKNMTGALCVVTVLVFLFDGRAMSGLWRYARVALLLAGMFFLYKTNSKTCLNLLVPAVGAGILSQRYNPAYRVFVIPLFAVLVMIAVVLLNAHLEELVAPLWGSDRTVLTGRVEIWPVLLRYASDHLVFGAGFGSFWLIGPDSPVYDYTDTWVTGVGNGHNGYLDLLVTVGLPGLLLALAGAVIMPLARLMMSARLSRASGGLLMSLLVFCVAQNGTESSLMDRDMLMQIFFMITVALIYEASRYGDAPRPPAAGRSGGGAARGEAARSPRQMGGTQG